MCVQMGFPLCDHFLIYAIYLLFQEAFTYDGLSQLWNELVRDDEITFGAKIVSLTNSAGVLAKKGRA